MFLELFYIGERNSTGIDVFYIEAVHGSSLRDELLSDSLYPIQYKGGFFL